MALWTNPQAQVRHHPELLPPFGGVFRSPGQVAHVLLRRSPLRRRKLRTVFRKAVTEPIPCPPSDLHVIRHAASVRPGLGSDPPSAGQDMHFAHTTLRRIPWLRRKPGCQSALVPVLCPTGIAPKQGNDRDYLAATDEKGSRFPTRGRGIHS